VVKCSNLINRDINREILSTVYKIVFCRISESACYLGGEAKKTEVSVPIRFITSFFEKVVERFLSDRHFTRVFIVSERSLLDSCPCNSILHKSSCTFLSLGWSLMCREETPHGGERSWIRICFGNPCVCMLFPLHDRNKPSNKADDERLIARTKVLASRFCY
jgi:hypothetical protein